jgi:type II secretory pathway component PulK
MIAAMAAVGVMADVALEALQTGRADLAAARAELDRARLNAEADGAVALVAHQVGTSEAQGRWPADGQPRTFAMDEDVVTAQVEDEGGKIPLNFVSESVLLRLFQLAGADPDLAQRLTTAFLRLRGGLPGSDPKTTGPLASLDELGALPEMTAQLFARIVPAVTLAAPTLEFNPRVAGPLAKAVMAPTEATAPSPDAPEGPPAPSASDTPQLVTVRLEVRDRVHGESLVRTEVVQFTGAPARPVIIRSAD